MKDSYFMIINEENIDHNNYIVKEGVEAYSTINNVRNNQDKQKSINRAEHRGDSRFYQNKDLTKRVSDGRSMACFMTF